MSLEKFQLKDDTSIDNSIIKRDFEKLHHQQGAQLYVSSQCVEFFFGENNNYHQIGKGYLQFDMTLSKNESILNTVDGVGKFDEPIRLINIASA